MQDMTMQDMHMKDHIANCGVNAYGANCRVMIWLPAA